MERYSDQERGDDFDIVRIVLDQSIGSKLLKQFYKDSVSAMNDTKYRKILAYALTRKYSHSKFFEEIPPEMKNDRRFLLECLAQFGLLIGGMESLQGDRGMAMTAIENNVSSFIFLSKELRMDRFIVLKTLKMLKIHDCDKCNIVKSIFEGNDEFSKDESVILEAVAVSVDYAMYAHEDLKRNRDFVLKLVKLNGKAIRYISPSLKIQQEVVFEAVMNSPSVLLFTPLVKDSNFVLKCIRKKRYPKFLKHLKPYQKNTEIISELVRKNGLELEYADESIRKYDKRIVLLALNQDGRALEFVQCPLLEDEQVTMSAIQSHPLSLEFAHEKFKENVEIVKIAIAKNPDALMFASPKVQRELKHFIIEETYQEEETWRPRIGTNFWIRNSMFYPIKRGNILEKIRGGMRLFSLPLHESNIARKDKEIMLEAIANDEGMFIYTNLKLEHDLYFLRNCIRKNKKSIPFVHESFLFDRDFMLETCFLYSIKDFEPNDNPYDR